jgi:hypothetical protein
MVHRSVTIHLERVFVELTDGCDTFECGSTSVRGAIGEIDQRHPGFADAMLTSTGKLRSHVELYHEKPANHRFQGHFLHSITVDEKLPPGSSVHIELQQAQGG